ncbi:putative DUF221 membrane protein [Aspergillus ibericus CBS 121593]|uniref:DUF221-domain-containing protein n=1 Tax=Aspergillus ibericus CBS 121593 TaxID=1448316 RepID=A0A395H829_9EURO|nr:DUF221-domain-containing protein [Aspergillus ibericus CBS 121593]RAL03038.1 DUF221-domain-containing protein [Aspergillus ibericus CBS 121593]
MDSALLVSALSNVTGRAQRSDKLAAKPFLVSLAIYGCLLFIAVYIFTFLKDKYANILYGQPCSQPRCDEGRDLERLHAGRVAWVGQLRRILGNEEGMIENHGVDSYLFLRFLTLALKLLVPLSLLAVPVLVPVYYTASFDRRNSGLDQFGISSVQKSESPRCWMIVLVVILSNIHICHLIFGEVRATVRIRQAYLHNPQQAKRVTTLTITGIPPEMANGTLKSIYSLYNNGPIQVIRPRMESREIKKTELRELSEVTSSRRRAPSSRGKRNTFRPAVPEAVASIGEKVSSKWHSYRLRRELNSATNVALLVFSDLFTAHLVLQTKSSAGPFLLKAQPFDSKELSERMYAGDTLRLTPIKDAIVRILLDALSIFWAILISLSGLLYLEPVTSRLNKLSDEQMAVIQGLLLQIALLIPFTVFQPLYTEVLIQRHYFIFLYVQVFLVVSVSSSVTTMVPDIVQNVQSVPQILADNLPKASSYFYSYLLLQALTQSVMVLFRLPESLWIRIHRHARRSLPKTIRWSLLYPVLTNLLCICIIYAIISPLILVVGVAVFAVLWLVYVYQAVYVLDTDVETAGLLCWQSLNHLFLGAYTMNIFLVGLFV